MPARDTGRSSGSSTTPAMRSALVRGSSTSSISAVSACAGTSTAPERAWSIPVAEAHTRTMPAGTSSMRKPPSRAEVVVKLSASRGPWRRADSSSSQSCVLVMVTVAPGKGAPAASSACPTTLPPGARTRSPRCVASPAATRAWRKCVPKPAASTRNVRASSRFGAHSSAKVPSPPERAERPSGAEQSTMRAPATGTKARSTKRPSTRAAGAGAAAGSDAARSGADSSRASRSGAETGASARRPGGTLSATGAAAGAGAAGAAAGPCFSVRSRTPIPTASASAAAATTCVETFIARTPCQAPSTAGPAPPIGPGQGNPRASGSSARRQVIPSPPCRRSSRARSSASPRCSRQRTVDEGTPAARAILAAEWPSKKRRTSVLR